MCQVGDGEIEDGEVFPGEASRGECVEFCGLGDAADKVFCAVIRRDVVTVGGDAVRVEG